MSKLTDRSTEITGGADERAHRPVDGDHRRELQCDTRRGRRVAALQCASAGGVEKCPIRWGKAGRQRAQAERAGGRRSARGSRWSGRRGQAGAAALREEEDAPNTGLAETTAAAEGEASAAEDSAGERNRNANENVGSGIVG